MKFSLARPTPADVRAIAALLWGRALAPPAPPAGRTGRRPPPSSIAAYLAVTALDVRMAAAARALGCDRAQLWRALRRVEDRRDDPAFDAALDAATQEMCPT